MRPDPYRPAAARWLGLSGRTLEKHRCTGTGPSYRKVGGRVVCMLSDLQAWVDDGERLSAARVIRRLSSSTREPLQTEIGEREQLEHDACLALRRNLPPGP